ncbi:MAG: ornithine carbamoyltransferase [Candidatus Omnitrophota bacterium]|jgi:ornithine carbamoyltransferase
MKRDLTSLFDLSTEEILSILDLAKKLKAKPLSQNNFLKGKSVGLIFEKPSNRTRVSFEVGVFHLGGKCIYLNPSEINLGIRESVSDVAKTLSRYLDLIVARTFTQQTILDLSTHASIPIINGLSDLSHPCQGLTDLLTIQEHCGGLKDVKIAYVGDGNNVTHSLLIGGAKVGAHINIATPKGCEIEDIVLESARKIAARTSSQIMITNDPKEAVKDADVIYTDTWISMGQENEIESKIKQFEGFQVNQDICKLAKDNFKFMHCLPAHRGQEVSENIIDGAHAIIFDQAENRLHTQKAIMMFLLTN